MPARLAADRLLTWLENSNRQTASKPSRLWMLFLPKLASPKGRLWITVMKSENNIGEMERREIDPYIATLVDNFLTLLSFSLRQTARSRQHPPRQPVHLPESLELFI